MLTFCMTRCLRGKWRKSIYEQGLTKKISVAKHCECSMNCENYYAAGLFSAKFKGRKLNAPAKDFVDLNKMIDFL